MKPDPEIKLLLAALDEAFDRRSWHGTNFLGSLRSVTVPEALWQPAAGRHNRPCGLLETHRLADHCGCATGLVSAQGIELVCAVDRGRGLSR